MTIHFRRPCQALQISKVSAPLGLKRLRPDEKWCLTCQETISPCIVELYFTARPLWLFSLAYEHLNIYPTLWKFHCGCIPHDLLCQSLVIHAYSHEYYADLDESWQQPRPACPQHIKQVICVRRSESMTGRQFQSKKIPKRECFQRHYWHYCWNYAVYKCQSGYNHFKQLPLGHYFSCAVCVCVFVDMLSIVWELQACLWPISFPVSITILKRKTRDSPPPHHHLDMNNSTGEKVTKSLGI